MEDAWESACDWEHVNMEDVQGHIQQHGVSGIEEFFKAKLERWKDVEIKIGVTGDSGVGKSSFINAIRGLADDEDGAAQTGVKETTRAAAVYPHPTNPKINFWDLPGIGTPNYPDLSTYCEKVGLEKYDTFLIFTAGRFTENDLALAKKVKFCKKSFFFVRTKIDQDYMNEKRKKAFKEEEMLREIMDDCLENLKGLRDGDEKVFLVSNHHPTKWDFNRLTQAILDVLPIRQRECLTLSLDALTSLSKDMIKRKAEVLRGRIWMVASTSAVGAVVPLPGLSVAVDIGLIANEVNLYKSQLGLPDEDSVDFNKMSPKNQEKVRQLCITSAVQLANFVAAYTASSTVEEFVRFIPFVGQLVAGSISFSSTYYFLQKTLNEMEETAMEFLDELTARAVDDLDID